MPIYVYRCSKGHELELLQSFNDPQPALCACGRSLERVLFPAAIRFKGSGFHNTDYPRYRESAAEASTVKKDKSGPKEQKSQNGKKGQTGNKAPSGE